jgi:hypothetical protein
VVALQQGLDLNHRGFARDRRERRAPFAQRGPGSVDLQHQLVETREIPIEEEILFVSAHLEDGLAEIGDGLPAFDLAVEIEEVSEDHDCERQHHQLRIAVGAKDLVTQTGHANPRWKPE